MTLGVRADARDADHFARVVDRRGMAGLPHVVWARAQEAERILATDVHPFHLEAARRSRADVVIDARHQDAPAAITRADHGRGADVVVLSTPALPTIAEALRSADRGGANLIFAAPEPGTTIRSLWGKCGGRGSDHTLACGSPADMRTALDAIADGRIDVATLITHRLPLERAAEAFEMVAEARDSIKVILEPAGRTSEPPWG